MTLSGNILIKHTVDQSGYRSHPHLVPLPPVPVARRQCLVAAQPTNDVFHLDPPPRERSVVATVLWRPPLSPWLASRRRPVQLGVDPVEADIAQVCQRPDLRPQQLANQPRAAQH